MIKVTLSQKNATGTLYVHNQSDKRIREGNVEIGMLMQKSVLDNSMICCNITVSDYKQINAK